MLTQTEDYKMKRSDEQMAKKSVTCLTGGAGGAASLEDSSVTGAPGASPPRPVPSGIPEIRYSMARSGLLKLARNALTT